MAAGKQRLIRILSDGTWRGSDIIDVESGETLRYVQHIDLHIDGGIDPASATMTVIAPSLDITAWAEVQQAAWLAALYKQLEEARAIIEELADPDADYEDAPKVAAREWLEKYPKDEVASDDE